MRGFEKIYAVILLIVVLLEMIAITAAPIVKIITTGEWRYSILWVFVPWLAAVAWTFYDVMKKWEDIR